MSKTRADYERRRWQIFGITWLAYFGFYLTRKGFSVAMVGMGEGTEIGLTGLQMALINGAYLSTYAIGQFLCGICGDRFGTRRVVGIGMFFSVLMGVAMGASSTAILIGVFFCIQGACQSTGWGPLSKNFSQFFSQRERGTMMGLWCTNYAVGGFVASIFASYVGEKFGFRYAFFIPAAVLFGIWILFLILQRNRPEDFGLPPIEEYHEEPAAALDEDQKPEGSWKAIFEVYTNPVVLRLAAVYFFLKPTRYAVLFWGPVYMSERLGTNMLGSGFLSSLFEVAGPLSVLLAGVITDKLFGSRRMPLCVICLFALAVLMFSMNKLPPSSILLGSSFFMIGLLLFAPDSLVSGTAAVDFGTKKGASTATGFINGCGSIGAIAGGTLPGILKDTWGWDAVFSLLAGSLLLAGLILVPKWNALPNTVAPK